MLKNKNAGKLISSGLVIVIAIIYIIMGRGNIFGQSEKPSTSSGNGQSQAQSYVENNGEKYEFRSKKLYDSHYKKHGKEFGSITQKEYLALANEVINSTTALRKTEGEDGDNVIYEEKDNMFLVLSTDGYIRTFFKPSDGINYYERQ